MSIAFSARCALDPPHFVNPSLFDHWSPELRRAVMRARPEFFAWSAERRARYGVAMPKADRARLDEALMLELFGLRFSSRKAAAAAVRDLSLDQLNQWNEVVLPLVGIGTDHFFLNEHFVDGLTILDFETVRDYDEHDHRFQQQARQQDEPGYVVEPYRGSLRGRWARLFVDGRFSYATLSMAASYLSDQVSALADELLSECIPHRYVPGRHHGEMEGDGWRWDMRIDADGKEEVLEALRQRIWEYGRSQEIVLSTDWDRRALKGVYLIDDFESPEANLHFVFTDKEALSAVRFSSFVQDCRALQRPQQELADAMAREQAALRSFVEQQHAEVVRSVNPKVRKLHSRRKVVIAKGAFDRLE